MSNLVNAAAVTLIPTAAEPARRKRDDGTTSVDATASAGKKAKKASKKKQTAEVYNFDGRSVQSMLRNGYRAQLDLLALADTKASIMISITGMSASVLVASGLFGFGQSAGLMLPSGALLLTFLTALTFAILAARPPRQSRDQAEAPMLLENDSVSVLHFANISRLTRDSYVDTVADVMTSSERTHRHMIVHLHELGSWLERKFRLLRVSYGVFLGGLMVSGVLFLGSGLDPAKLVAAAEEHRFLAFGGVVEASAVAQAPDGRLLVLQDEAHLPMVALTLRDDGGVDERNLTVEDSAVLPALNDLEGTARKGQWIYAITSHARTRSGELRESRQRLVRFRVVGDEIVEPTIVGGDDVQNVSQI